MKVSDLIIKLLEQGTEISDFEVKVLTSGEWGWESPKSRSPKPAEIPDVVTVDKLGTVYLIAES